MMDWRGARRGDRNHQAEVSLRLWVHEDLERLGIVGIVVYGPEGNLERGAVVREDVRLFGEHLEARLHRLKHRPKRRHPAREMCQEICGGRVVCMLWCL